MPYEWIEKPNKAPFQDGAFSHAAGDAPAAKLHLWPYRSLPRRGFVWFVGGTLALISLPLYPLLGTLALWGLLPFLLGAVVLLWVMLERSYRDGEVLEELLIWSDHIELTRHNPRTPQQHWTANPYWTRLTMQRDSGPVPHYVTLGGGGRRVEIGAFLSEDERLHLYDDLSQFVTDVRITP